LSAILIDVTRDLREHPLLAGRSVLLGWAVVIAWVESSWTTYLWHPVIPSGGSAIEFLSR
jgi:hypothetical protein